MIQSTSKKNNDATVAKTNTMMVVTVVSRPVGQVTFASSERTSRKNFMSYPTKNIDADIQMTASLEPVSPYVGVRYAKVKG